MFDLELARVGARLTRLLELKPLENNMAEAAHIPNLLSLGCWCSEEGLLEVQQIELRHRSHLQKCYHCSFWVPHPETYLTIQDQPGRSTQPCNDGQSQANIHSGFLR